MQQFMNSFESLSPPDAILAAVENGNASSFCVFTHQNATSPGPVCELTDALCCATAHGGQLPLQPSAETQIAVVTVIALDLMPANTCSSVMLALIASIRRHTPTMGFEIELHLSDIQIAAALESRDAADIVIVGTVSAHHDSTQARFADELIRRGKHPIVIAMRTPCDLTAFASVNTYPCTYGVRRVSMEAAARVLFGEVETRGVLPCAMSGATTRYRA